MIPAAANATAGLLGLFIFVSFFALVIFSLVGHRAKTEADQHALIPFKEETPNG